MRRISLLLMGILSFAQIAMGVNIVATAPLVDEASGRTVGFATNEESTYFLLPKQWSTRKYEDGPSAFVSDAGNGSVDVRFALAADYAATAPTVARIRAQDFRAMFFPLPRVYESMALYLPAALGSTQVTLEPDGAYNNLPVAYYRVRFSEPQFETLKSLARGGLTLTGAVTASFATPGAETRTTLPISINIAPGDLELSTPRTAQSGAAWLRDLLENYELRQNGFMDERYNLGGFVQVTFSESALSGSFISGTFSVNEQGNSFLCVPTASPNYAGNVSFRISELGVTVNMEFAATVGVALHAMSMEVSLTRFDVNSIVVGGELSSFYTQLIKGFLSRGDVREEISQTLTQELQRRILSQSLFGIEEELL